MADRTVKVTLIAEATGYVQGMDQASKKTRELGTESEKLAQKKQSFETIGTALLAVGIAASVGVGLAISKFAEFDAAMSNVNAVAQETAANQALLRDAALETGAVTVFTATESAHAIEELGKAGIGTSDILSGALKGSLDLAASGQLEVARAAEITGITLKQFSLDGTQAARVADVLSAGANKAVGSVEDLAQGLKFVGPQAAAMNVSLEDTVATLSLFADQGIVGEQAGTALRGMLASLASPSKQAREELDRLDISVYDASGRFAGMENLVGQLNTKLGGLSQAERDASLGIIFTNAQLTTAQTLVQAGADKWAEYRDAVDDSGVAARIAAQRMDNLQGDVEKLGGAFDTYLIKSGSGANDVLRAIVQTVTFLVDVVGGLPEPLLAAGVGVGSLVAVLGVAAGVTALGIVKYSEYKVALKEIGIAGGVAALRVGAVSAAVGLATIIIGQAITIQAEYRASIDSIRDSLNAATGAATDYTRELQFQSLQGDGGPFSRNAIAAAKQMGISIQLVTDAASGNKNAIAEVKRQIDAYTASNAFAGYVASDLWNAIGEANLELEQAQREWRDLSAATNVGSDANMTAADSMRDAAEAGRELNEVYGEQLQAAISLGGAYDTIVQANIDYAQSVADATDDAEDSWETYYDGFTVNVDQYLAELQRQVDAQNAWEANMIILAGRVSSGVLEELAALGPEAAPLIQELATASDEELSKLEGIYAEKGQGAVDSFESKLEDGAPVIRELAARYGEGVAQEIAAKLAAGAVTVEQIVAEYKLKIEQAPPPIFQVNTEVARQKILDLYYLLRNPPQPGDIGFGTVLAPYPNASGGMFGGGVKAFASGGFASGMYPYTPGGIHKFAEAGDEAYISFLPQYAQRNRQIVMQSAERLNMYQPAPAQFRAAPMPTLAPSMDGVRISGSLDLGDGLVGVIDGVIRSEIADGTIPKRLRNYNNAL